MNRRRPVVRRRKHSRISATPIVFFLLIASFGILFAGCSASPVAIHGPSSDQMTDTSFTSNDIAKFRELATSSATTTDTAVSSAGDTVVLSANSGTALPTDAVAAADIDLSQAPVYQSLRQAPSTAKQNEYIVNNSIVNVRSAPSSASALLRTLSQGTTVTVLAWENGEWAKIQIPGGGEGFVTIRYLAKPVTEADLAAKKKFFENQYYVSYQFVNVRSVPEQSGNKLGQIPSKTILTADAVQGGWAKIDFQGKPGYVSLDYLTKFAPTFIVVQGSYNIPVLRYTVTDDASLQLLVSHLTALKGKGIRLLNFRQFRQMLLDQQKNGGIIGGKSALIAVTGLTADNVRKVSDALTSNSFTATLFLNTKEIGISGITQKTLLTIIANGLDVQSAGHTGDDLRALTNAQVKLELIQSRKLLEDATGKPVFAVFYPQGGGNERVESIASDAAYLFGIDPVDAKTFTRADLLHMPSHTVTSAETADDILRLFQ